MKILVIASTDADNWHIVNICKELVSRGHTLVVYNTQSHADMFVELGLKVEPISRLTKRIVKTFDIALCGDIGGRALMFHDIYIFTYEISFIFFMPDLGDFVLRFWNGKDKRYDLNAAQVAIGNPKNDSISDEVKKETKKILYIDTGHIPFGYEGKKDLADMLLQICNENPDYELTVKPRWLPTQQAHLTHANEIHIYDVISERSNFNVPENLVMLNMHLDLHELICASDCVISPPSGAVIDVLSQGKGLCIVDGFPMEDKFDIRISMYERLRDFFIESGCIVNIKDVALNMPKGIKCNENYINKILPQVKGASARATQLMEHVYTNYLKRKKYPAAGSYEYSNYETQLKQSALSYDEIKQLRFANHVKKQMIASEDFVNTSVDFTELYLFIDKNYKNYPFTKEGYDSFYKDSLHLKNRILYENKYLLDDDPINQSFLMDAMYEIGCDDEIINMQDDKVLAAGPYNYYLGRIMQERSAVDECVNNYAKFILDANTRGYEKYKANVFGYGIACRELCKLYNGENVAPIQMLEVIEALFSRNRQNIVPYRILLNAYNLLSQQLDDKKVDLTTNLENYRLRNEVINLKKRINSIDEKSRFGITRYIKPGVDCVKEHGLVYTIKYILTDKINIKKRAAKLFIAPLQMLRQYRTRVLGGYRTYSALMHKYGVKSKHYMPVFGLGDIYIFSSKFNAFASRLPGDEIPVYLVYQKAGSEIAKLFKINKNETLSIDEYRSLYYLLMFGNNTIRLHSLHLHVLIRHTGILSRLYGYKGAAFSEYTQSFAYKGISDKEKQPPVFDDNNIEELFNKHKLSLNKTILLSPHAKSIQPIPDAFWEGLAQALTEMGYDVCTNCAYNQNGELEEGIYGTKPIFIPFKNLVPFLNKTVGIIALRSGFQDVSESANCLNISLQVKTGRFPHAYDSLNEIYSMKKMYGREDMHDLLYTNRNGFALINQIKSLVTNYENNRRKV